MTSSYSTAKIIDYVHSRAEKDACHSQQEMNLRAICTVTSTSSSLSAKHIADLRSSVKIVFDSDELMYSVIRHMKVATNIQCVTFDL